jgi:L-aspartate oxidase
MLITKARVDEGSTKWAQGGIAAALGPGDSPDQHERDTLVAGAGLCDLPAVKVLVSEGPEAVRKLIARGAVFDKSETGEIALTREGGHLRNRILHAGGDATGAEVSRALLAAVSKDPGIEVIEHALVLDALKSETGRVCGVTLHVIGEGSRDGVGRIMARAVVLATGGLGQFMPRPQIHRCPQVMELPLHSALELMWPMSNSSNSIQLFFTWVRTLAANNR